MIVNYIFTLTALTTNWILFHMFVRYHPTRATFHLLIAIGFIWLIVGDMAKSFFDIADFSDGPYRALVFRGLIASASVWYLIQMRKWKR